MGRTLSGAERKEAKSKPVKNLSTLCLQDTLEIYVAVEGRLAAQYVLQLLAQDKNIKIAAMQDLPMQPSVGKSSPIFIFDKAGFELPLNQCFAVLSSKYPGARFLLLGEARSSQEVAQFLSAGVHGFLSYDEVSTSLLAAIHSIAQGRLWMSSRVLPSNPRASSVKVLTTKYRISARSTLTPRETEIMELAKRRLSNKEIAALLGIQASTVKFHLSNIYSKLQISYRNDLNRAAGGEWWRKVVAC